MRTSTRNAYALFLKHYIQFQMHIFSMHNFFLLHIDGNWMVLIVFRMIFYQTNIFFHLFGFFFHSNLFFKNFSLENLFFWIFFSGWFFFCFIFFSSWFWFFQMLFSSLRCIFQTYFLRNIIFLRPFYRLNIFSSNASKEVGLVIYLQKNAIYSNW